jgi:hypothetical protein
MTDQLHKKGAAPARRLSCTVAGVTLMTPAIAFAYVDPGTGAYVVQSIMALIGVTTFYAMRPFRYLRNLLTRRNKPESQD